MNIDANPSRHRMRLFQIACISLFTGTTAFMNHATPPHYQLQQRTSPMTRPSASSISPKLRRSQLFAVLSSGPTAAAAAAATTSDDKRPPLLTPEEEKDLLRRAVEYRRLNALERDLAMQHPSKQLPLLSVRAQAAGYGDELDAYEDAKYEGQKAREQLVTRNMGLVHYCVNNIIGREIGVGNNNGSASANKRNPKREQNSRLRLNFLSREDLIQEGAIGLARAVDRWNPDIGGKFSTYAVYWVRAAVLRCIAERDDMLRVPSHVTDAVRKINKAAGRLGWELDTAGMISFGAGAIGYPQNSVSWREANTAKKLAEEAGLTDRTYEEAMKVRGRRYNGGYVPFEQWMQKGQNMESDIVVASASVGLDESSGNGVMSVDDTEVLRSMLSKFLRPKEMEALSWRYGLLKDDPLNDKESAVERANRQFAEMEDQLFGATPMAATTAAVAATGVPTYASTMPAGPAKGRFGEAMTFTEVGKKMQVSAEYTRKLCHQALDKLRQAADEGRLEPALLY